jgi:hypothetical protein
MLLSAFDAVTLLYCSHTPNGPAGDPSGGDADHRLGSHAANNARRRRWEACAAARRGSGDDADGRHAAWWHDARRRGCW